MFHHDIHFTHTRHPIVHTFAAEEASSATSISVDSNDLVEALSEMLGRLPVDVLMALRTAMELAVK